MNQKDRIVLHHNHPCLVSVLVPVFWSLCLCDSVLKFSLCSLCQSKKRISISSSGASLLFVVVVVVAVVISFSESLSLSVKTFVAFFYEILLWWQNKIQFLFFKIFFFVFFLFILLLLLLFLLLIFSLSILTNKSSFSSSKITKSISMWPNFNFFFLLLISDQPCFNWLLHHFSQCNH